MGMWKPSLHVARHPLEQAPDIMPKPSATPRLQGAVWTFESLALREFFMIVGSGDMASTLRGGGCGLRNPRALLSVLRAD